MGSQWNLCFQTCLLLVFASDAATGVCRSTPPILSGKQTQETHRSENAKPKFPCSAANRNSLTHWPAFTGAGDHVLHSGILRSQTVQIKWFCRVSVPTRLFDFVKFDGKGTACVHLRFAVTMPRGWTQKTACFAHFRTLLTKRFRKGPHLGRTKKLWYAMGSWQPAAFSVGDKGLPRPGTPAYL